MCDIKGRQNEGKCHIGAMWWRRAVLSSLSIPFPSRKTLGQEKDSRDSELHRNETHQGGKAEADDLKNHFASFLCLPAAT